VTALDQPIILSGTTDSGTRYVQFWTEKEKIAGREVAFCRAEMNDGESYAPHRLVITRACPLLWVEKVLAVFPVFLNGAEIPATHTVTWLFSVPTFTPIERPAEGGLLDLAHELAAGV
jgi:hypothetical protein